MENHHSHEGNSKMLKQHEHDDHSHHNHNHHDHDHHHSIKGIALAWPFIITLGFAFVEAIGGWLTGSLALLGDAGHMFSDSAGLGLAAFGAWVAMKPASKRHSYGLVRAEVMVALINGLAMLGVLVFIVLEAVERMHHPQPVQGAQVVLIALVGLIVNIVVAKQLHQHQHNLNARAAFLHVMGDMLGSVAAIIAGAVIYFTGWLLIDPILSFFIAALILFSTFNLLKEVLHVLMEGVPSHLEIEAIQQKMQLDKDVLGVHQIHVWSLSSEKIALSAHVVLTNANLWHDVLHRLNHVLQDEFGIVHITLQPETHHAHDLENPSVTAEKCILTTLHS